MEHIPIEGGENPADTAERREGLRINSIVIPANDDEPLRRQQIDATDLDAYRDLVNGNLEALGLDYPAASMYLNGDGKTLGLPVNGRATMLLWAHLKEIRFRDFIVGDAFLTGPVNRDGWDTDIPEELTKLFDAQHLRIEVQTYGDPQWYGNDQHFPIWTAAYAYALELAHRWTQVEDVRIVPIESAPPPEQQQEAG